MKTSIAESSIGNEQVHRVGITGASSSDPTLRAGIGVTVTHDATGVYKYAFTDNPGTFVGIGGWALRADTASGVKGYSLSAATYVAPAGTTKGYINVSIWDASNNAVDLTSTQYLDISFLFSFQRVIT